MSGAAAIAAAAMRLVGAAGVATPGLTVVADLAALQARYCSSDKIEDAQMALTYISEMLRIDGLTSISVSDIEPDVESGGFARRIEFYTDAIDVLNRRPVLTVMTYGEEENLRIITPTLSF
jgi:hypothetical protein